MQFLGLPWGKGQLAFRTDSHDVKFSVIRAYSVTNDAWLHVAYKYLATDK